MATFTGDSSNNLLEGGNDDDVLLGKDGDDTLVGGLGNDVLLGGSDTDLARFSGHYSDYTLFPSTLPTAIVGPDGTDYLTSSLELLKFADASVRLRWRSVPRTNDFKVNDYTDGDQSNNAVARFGDGSYVIVWTSESQDGDSLGVFGQRYSSLGTPIDTEFQANSSTTGAQLEPVVASLAGGGFVVVWTSESQDGDSLGVFGQRYDAAGARAGGEFQINTATVGEQYDSAAAGLAEGGFIVTWTSKEGDADDTDICAQRYTNDGVRTGSEFRVNTTTANAQDASTVAALADGGFVVTWDSFEDDPQGDVLAQRYAGDGAQVGGEFTVNTQITGAQTDSAVAGLAEGGFVVTWTSTGQDGDSNGIYAQRYAATGEALGSEFRVNTVTVDSQSDSAVAALLDDGFIVTWTSLGQDGDQSGIYAQAFTSAGAGQGAAFRANAYTLNNQVKSSVAALGVDQFIVSWDSFEQDAPLGYGIFASGFRLALAGIDAIGDESDQALAGIAGNDTLRGNAGADLLEGGAGSDSAVFSEKTANEALRVVLRGSTPVDVWVAGAAEDRLSNIENLIGGAGGDTFIGDGRANRLVGNAGDDTLQGRSGKDTLEGGAGVDVASFADKAATQGVRVTLAVAKWVKVVVAGKAEDRLRGIENLIGGKGNDSLGGDRLANTLSGQGGNDRLDGKGRNDVLFGGAGRDLLIGGAGDDILHGQAGKDVLKGGFGADWFVFDTALNAVSNVDTITDFQPGTDKLVLDDDIFTRLAGTLTGTALSADNFVLGTAALDADDYLVYDPATGTLRYDADGSAGGAAIQFATLIVTGSGVPGAADFLVVA